jgi:hypothetical protein
MFNLQPPHGKNIIVYDLEIKEPIEGPVTWDRHDLMGISVGVAYHYLTGEFKVYMDDNLPELAVHLHEAELISGFNIIGFDNRLMDATLDAKGELARVLNLRSYDLLVESRKAAGWTPSQSFPKSMRLDDHLSSTFGKAYMKTANGAEAPLMWKNRELGRLISYCIDDVKRECMLFEHVWNGRPVSTPLHAARVLDRARFSSAPPPLPPTPPELAQTSRDNW